MPRKVQHVPVYLALSANMLGAAFNIAPRHIYAAIERGELEVKTLPGSSARRVLVSSAIDWYRTHWITAKKTKRSPNG